MTRSAGADTLTGLQVLVTRPEAQAEAWADTLRARGAHAVVAPLLTLSPVSTPEAKQAIKQCILDFDLYQKAIFVSQNAVAYAFEWLEDYWPQLPIRIEYYGVGERTGRALEAYGVPVTAWQSDGAMNSEALLAAPELQSVAGERIVIFRGVGGRGVLAETLRERGARVDYCELYQRQCPDDAATQLNQALVELNETPLMVALHSGETLENFHQVRRALPSDQARRLARGTLLVPGERVAQQARALGYTRVLTAENATDPGMLAALERAAIDPTLLQTDGTHDCD
ncbi:MULTISPECIES: uroporphyrinogen-III synthase [unclassified Marinimicrobium]|uniref:uroporphyrinogen-III synthase n=1 Tax=Marinimicrobium TaxID=359337 RepID=UPI00257B3537|nr:MULTISPECIES: uroporphyrinogen-III synthase [unclassified Marinimicrobium]